MANLDVLIKAPFTPSMPCAPGTRCCGGGCVFPSDPSCALSPFLTPNATGGSFSPPPHASISNSSCSSLPDNHILCTSPGTYKFCVGGGMYFECFIRDVFTLFL